MFYFDISRSKSTRFLRRYLHNVCATVLIFPLLAHAQNRMTLDQALQLSAQNSTTTKAAEASVEASRQAEVRAAQLPDPVLKFGIDNVPVTGADRGSTTRDFMTMRRIGVEQQWVSAGKRLARSALAERMTALESGNSFITAAKVREETTKAWIAVFYAQRELSIQTEVEKRVIDTRGAAEAAFRGAKASASDVGQANLMISQVHDDVQKAVLELKNAKFRLSRWTQAPVESVGEEMPALISIVPQMSAEDLQSYHPRLLLARRSIDLADAGTTVATRERNPDWSFEAGFSQRPAFSNMVSVGISIPIPSNRANKQDREIAEKSALGTKARLEYEDAIQSAQLEIQSLSANLESLKTRISLQMSKALPVASEQVELAISAYRAGSGSLGAIYIAQKALLERRLQINAMERDAAFAWAQLETSVIPGTLGSNGSAKP